MTQSNLFIIRESLFGKGYNDKLSPEFIPKGYMADILNGVITDERITKRTGYSLRGNDTGDTPILGLQGIRQADGTRRLYKFADNSGGTETEIWEWTGSGNWTSLDQTLFATQGNDVNCTVAENVVHCFNGADTPVIITPGSPGSAAAAGDSNYPAGAFSAWFHNFHFVAGVSSLPNRLYWSDLDDSDDFTNGVTGSVDINPNDGDVITGLSVLGNELIIFKKNRIWSLTGFGTSTFDVANVNERITGFGTASHRSIVNVGNDLYFLTHVGGVPEFRSLQRTRFGEIVSGGIISDHIRGTMDGLNEGRLDQVTGIFDGRRAYWAYPLSGSTTNNQMSVYDTVTKGWVRWTGANASIFAEIDFSSESQIYFGEAGNNSLVYRFDTTTNDNGTAISFRVDTRNYGGDRPEIKKKWKYLYTTTETAGSYNLTVQESPDGFTFEELGTIDLSSAGGVLPMTLDTDKLGATDIKKKRLPFSKRTSYFNQLRFIQAGLDQSAVLRDWELLYLQRGLRNV